MKYLSFLLLIVFFYLQTKTICGDNHLKIETKNNTDFSTPEETCIDCVSKMNIFFKVIWFGKNIHYQCYRIPTFLSKFVTIVDFACKQDQCENISSRLPRYLGDRENFLCNHKNTEKPNGKDLFENGENYFYLIPLLRNSCEIVLICIVIILMYKRRSELINENNTNIIRNVVVETNDESCKSSRRNKACPEKSYRDRPTSEGNNNIC